MRILLSSAAVGYAGDGSTCNAPASGKNSIKDLPIVLLHFMPSSTKVTEASQVSEILDKEN